MSNARLMDTAIRLFIICYCLETRYIFIYFIGNMINNISSFIYKQVYFAFDNCEEEKRVFILRIEAKITLG